MFIVADLVSLSTSRAYIANNVEPDQTAPFGAV